MLHSEADNKILQVELNTIATSFAGMATAVTEYQRYVHSIFNLIP